MGYKGLTTKELLEQLAKNQRSACFANSMWSSQVSSTVSVCLGRNPSAIEAGHSDSYALYRELLKKINAGRDQAPPSMTADEQDSEVGMSDVRGAMDMVYQWEYLKQGRMASAYVVYFVESNFSKHNLSAVNDMLRSAAPERLTEWSLVALLRSSYVARHQLPAWYSFMGAVRERLKDNERLERLLIGLNQE